MGRQLASVTLLAAALGACGGDTAATDAGVEQGDAATIDAATPDATQPVEPDDFVSGGEPACPGPVPPQPPTGCLAQVAELAWGDCDLPDGFVAVDPGGLQPDSRVTALPAALISQVAPDECFVLAFADTDCGPAVAAFALGWTEQHWAGLGLAGRECWFTTFGRVCAALLPLDEQVDIEVDYCSYEGFGVCTSDDVTAVIASADGLRSFPLEGDLSYCGGGACSCW